MDDYRLGTHRETEFRQGSNFDVRKISAQPAQGMENQPRPHEEPAPAKDGANGETKQGLGDLELVDNHTGVSEGIDNPNLGVCAALR